MAISLKSAEAAMTALRKADSKAEWEALSASKGYLFSKHMTKKDAKAAALKDNETKGYFKKISTKYVPDFATYRDLRTHQQKGMNINVDAGANKKQFGKAWSAAHTKAKKDAEQFEGLTRYTDAMGSHDYSQLITKVIATDGSFYQAGAEADTRFVYITPIPSGYVGRSISPAGDKAGNTDDTELGYAALIVVASPGGSPFVLNMFPVNESYIANQVALT